MPSEPSYRRTILLAEDDPDLRRIFSDTLQFRGYSVREAANGDECLELAREGCPDLVILDIMMPRRDGIDTAARLREAPDTATVPILALTASTDPAIHRRALRAGCDLVLTKPIAPGDLLRGIHCLLEERDASRGGAEETQRFASRERTDAAELISRAAEVVRELSAGAPAPSETELRQRLQGIQLVPACSSCGRVRTAGGQWREIPAVLRTFFDQWTSLSHAICPECFAREYPDFPRKG